MPAKGRIGFQTSATNLEDIFAKVQEELFKKNVEWETLGNMWVSALTTLLKDIDFSKPDAIERETAFGILSLFAVAQIAALGKELTETHERLAKVEKDIRELKLKT